MPFSSYLIKVPDEIVSNNTLYFRSILNADRLGYCKAAEKALNAWVTRRTAKELGITLPVSADKTPESGVAHFAYISAEVRKHTPDLELDRLVQRVFDGIVTFVICMCLTPFREELEIVWDRLGISDLEARAEHARVQWGSLRTTPVVRQMIGMYLVQAMGKYESGNLLDLLQSLYLHYEFTWYTRDAAVIEYGSKVERVVRNNLIRNFDEIA